jgi:cytochrome c oxidase assembly factor CtaG
MSLSAAALPEGAWTVAEIVVPLLIVGAYLVRVRTLAREGRPVPAWRQFSSTGGLVIFAASTATPIETLSNELVLAHMGQHLLLADLASLLFVLGLTGPMMQPLLAHPLLRPLRLLAHPVVAITLFTANLYLWHTPMMYQAVVDSTPLHVLEHFSFIFFGVFMWMPLFGPLPMPAWFGRSAHIVYTAAIWLTGMALANTLMWSGRVFYPDYSATVREHGLSPLGDQSIAGGILMVWCMVMALGILAWVFLRWARDDTERQDLLDLAASRGVPLTSERAERAANAGAGELLRERINREAAAGKR